ncbi:hypothetical protein [Clostridium novyi]|uniref:hypothetical protein n=1 Tax=Clostridium novyi TaxID=1542 RepID=UPI00069189C1|nr:hypothetical protein [Clostridium novyi]
MNLTIDCTQQPNYVNKTITSKKNTNFNSLLDDKKISEEEDKILYELYKKSHMMHTAFSSVEDAKKHRVSFPPSTAPGRVRRAWRQLLEKASPEERSMLEFLGDIFMYKLREQKFNIPNNLNDYFHFLSEMKDYLQSSYHNVPGESNELYESLMNVFNKFETELKKYK